MKTKYIFIIAVIVILCGCCCKNRNKDVYRYFLGKKDGYAIWIVDGATVRKTIYSSFLYGGNEQRYPFTPKKEIWIDNALSCEEFEMTLAHEMNERHLMAKFGWSYDQAHDSSLAIEVALRRNYNAICRDHEARLPKMSVTDYSNKKEIKDIPDSVSIRNIYRIPVGTRNGTAIWIVDGYMVRATVYPDFGFSGNDLSCHFIPPKEIWIDGQISCEETEFSIASELLEREEMAKGKSYSDAYLIAINHIQKLREAMENIINQHPFYSKGDTITRDAGIIDPNEK